MENSLDTYPGNMEMLTTTHFYMYQQAKFNYQVTVVQGCKCKLYLTDVQSQELLNLFVCSKIIEKNQTGLLLDPAINSFNGTFLHCQAAYTPVQVVINNQNKCNIRNHVE
jgi:hypothetical protein